MLIEALTPLRVKDGSQVFALEPGQPVEFSDDRARKLLAKAPGKVRAIAPLRAPEQTTTPPLQVGMIVEWDSPLFGLLAGVVIEVAPHTITVFHPLGEREATIPRTWLRRRMEQAMS